MVPRKRRFDDDITWKPSLSKRQRQSQHDAQTHRTSGDPADGHTFLAYTNLPDYHRRDTHSLSSCSLYRAPQSPKDPSELLSKKYEYDLPGKAFYHVYRKMQDLVGYHASILHWHYGLRVPVSHATAHDSIFPPSRLPRLASRIHADNCLIPSA